MKIDDRDLIWLQRINVGSILELALTLPRSYEDFNLSPLPNEGINTVEVVIEHISRSRSFLMSLVAFCKTWGCDVTITIFNPKKWHYSVFKPKKEFFIQAKSSFNYGCWQFINPKILTKVGIIIPRYKTNLDDEKLQNLIKKYVNEQNLLQVGLNSDEAKTLLSLHETTKESMEKLLNLQENKEVLNLLKFVEIYNYLKRLNTKKTEFKAKPIAINDISLWLKNLPFTPTKDQILALNDIKIDLQSQKASKRVIMGDVGSGKTLVILGAALMVYPNLAILMVPTAILAEQIYYEAKRLLPDYFNAVVLKKGEKNVDFTGVNLLISTHALLYQNLPPSSLIMIDEQHRFGSNQRQKLDQLTEGSDFKAHFLQFSATPIPRTLSLIQSELVNFSFLTEIPYKKNIHTIIIQNKDFNDLLTHIKEQIAQNKQTIIVYPLVTKSDVSAYKSIDEGSKFWLNSFDKVFITHGQDKQKEEIIAKFKDEGNILLATTVIEVGISLPRLTTVVILAPERLGLASLHQLRGRVGRNGGEGWCFLYTKLQDPPQRLIKFAEILDGFEIAKLDLKNRQAGDILDGTLQHGATFKYYDMEEEITLAAKQRLHTLK